MNAADQKALGALQGEYAEACAEALETLFGVVNEIEASATDGANHVASSVGLWLGSVVPALHSLGVKADAVRSFKYGRDE